MDEAYHGCLQAYNITHFLDQLLQIQQLSTLTF
jgi:hypothetical protein